MTGIISEMRRVVASVIGDDSKAADVVYALISNFGGEKLYLPTNDYQRRNEEIRELRKAGASTSQLVKRYRLSRATICRIISD